VVPEGRRPRERRIVLLAWFDVHQGQGVTQNYLEAAKWYRKGAEQGDAAAQFSLGSMYNEGKGVSQDYSEAIKWYRKAAEQGNAAAQFSLGSMYETGQGIVHP